MLETCPGVAGLTKRAVVVGEPIVDQIIAVVIDTVTGFGRRRDIGACAHHTTSARFGSGNARANALGPGWSGVTGLREGVVGHIAYSRAGVAEVVGAEVRVIAGSATCLLNVGGSHHGKTGPGVTVVVAVLLILAVARLSTT